MIKHIKSPSEEDEQVQKTCVHAQMIDEIRDILDNWNLGNVDEDALIALQSIQDLIGGPCRPG